MGACVSILGIYTLLCFSQPSCFLCESLSDVFVRVIEVLLFERKVWTIIGTNIGQLIGALNWLCAVPVHLG